MSSASSGWHSQLSFIDRFQHITSISSGLYKASYPRQDDTQKAAKELESSIYSSASSLDEYKRRCEEAARSSVSTNGPASTNRANDAEVSTPLSPAVISIGKYEHATHYRNGIFSEVYRAPALDSVAFEGSITADTVALKVTTPSMMVAPHDSEKEARLLKTLAAGPNIIPLIETFRQGSQYILVFPFMPLSLDTMLSEGKLDAIQAQTHLKDMFQALAFLHSRNIIHRDVKPSNLLLRAPEGPGYLSDFGISWGAEDSSSEPAADKITDVGTTCYRPPEILFGKNDYDSSLDMWSAGCVVAEIGSLSNKTLFESGSVGTELALIQSIFMKLGTPDERTWPSAQSCPDWGKMQWKEFEGQAWSELLPNAPPNVCDLAAQLVQYESSWRLTAKAALKHPYFQNQAET